MKKIVVIDGQGGKIGKMIIEALQEYSNACELIAIGTNALATNAMIKGGAKKAATGENPVVVNVRDADIIIGPIGLLVTNALLGEITEKMVVAIGDSSAKKILIPVTKCNQVVVGIQDLPLTKYIELAIEEVKQDLHI